MSKVTSKLQVTVPKAIAEQYGISPGDEIGWTPAGEVIKVTLPGRSPQTLNPQIRLKLFDQATDRQKQRQKKRILTRQLTGRGWTREDLYRDGRRSH